MPIGMNCSLQRFDGRPIKRRDVVSAKKLVMVIRGLNTGDSLFAEVEESLTTMKSPYPSLFSNSFSSLGTDQGVQGLMALPKSALQTQDRRNEGRRNEGRRNEAR